MKDFFEKLDEMLRPKKAISDGEDLVDSLVIFAIMALLLFTIIG